MDEWTGWPEPTPYWSANDYLRGPQLTEGQIAEAATEWWGSNHEYFYGKALRLAARCHAGQTRKGDGATPYLAHPVRVARYLEGFGLGMDAVATGFLHDTLEETPPERRAAWRQELLANVGTRVVELIEAVSDANPEAPWLERKQAYLRHLVEAPQAALAVSCADKLDNTLDIQGLLLRFGSGALQRFNAPLAERIVYHEEIFRIIGERLPECPLVPIANTAVAWLKSLDRILAGAQPRIYELQRGPGNVLDPSRWKERPPDPKLQAGFSRSVLQDAHASERQRPGSTEYWHRLTQKHRAVDQWNPEALTRALTSIVDEAVLDGQLTPELGRELKGQPSQESAHGTR